MIILFLSFSFPFSIRFLSFWNPIFLYSLSIRFLSFCNPIPFLSLCYPLSVFSSGFETLWFKQLGNLYTHLLFYIFVHPSIKWGFFLWTERIMFVWQTFERIVLINVQNWKVSLQFIEISTQHNYDFFILICELNLLFQGKY